MFISRTVVLPQFCSISTTIQQQMSIFLYNTQNSSFRCSVFYCLLSFFLNFPFPSISPSKLSLFSPFLSRYFPFGIISWNLLESNQNNMALLWISALFINKVINKKLAQRNSTGIPVYNTSEFICTLIFAALYLIYSPLCIIQKVYVWNSKTSLFLCFLILPVPFLTFHFVLLLCACPHLVQHF